MIRIDFSVVCLMLFTCIAANIQGINRKDSIIHHTICCEDTIRKDDPFAVNEKLVLIVKSEDISAGKEETWIGKYGGVILGFCLGLLSFVVQQIVKNYCSKITRIKNYKQAINNYIDYITAAGTSIPADEKIVLAKHLIYPSEGPYINEYSLKIFKSKVDAIRNLLLQYKKNGVGLADFNVRLKNLKFGE